MKPLNYKKDNKAKKCRSACVVSNALDVVGDKWTLLIVRDMLFFGRREYNEFMQSPEGISTNILASRLKAMVATGICTRRSHPTDGKKVLYELTDMGLDLARPLIEMALWADRYIPDACFLPEVDVMVKADKDSFIDACVSRARAARFLR